MSNVFFEKLSRFFCFKIENVTMFFFSKSKTFQCFFFIDKYSMFFFQNRKICNAFFVFQNRKNVNVFFFKIEKIQKQFKIEKSNTKIEKLNFLRFFETFKIKIFNFVYDFQDFLWFSKKSRFPRFFAFFKISNDFSRFTRFFDVKRFFFPVLDARAAMHTVFVRSCSINCLFF